MECAGGGVVGGADGENVGDEVGVPEGDAVDDCSALQSDIITRRSEKDRKKERGVADGNGNGGEGLR